MVQVRLTDDPSNLWLRFRAVLQEWSGEHAEVLLDAPAIGDISRIDTVLRKWCARTGSNWEDDFTGFTPSFREQRDVEMVRLTVGGLDVYCLASWERQDQLQIVVGMWPPDLVVAKETDPPPDTFIRLVDFLRELSEAGGFRRCTFLLEGDRLT